MKNILAIFAIGLMLATAFSGCVGGEKTSGTDTTTGTNTTGTSAAGNETMNQTGENATENQTEIPENYHAEYDDDMPLTDMSYVTHQFPVKEGAKKIIITLKPTFMVPLTLPDNPVLGGCIGAMDVWIYDSKENAVVEDVPSSEVTYEITGSQITNYGKWRLEMFPEDPEVTVHSIIDVFYQ
jgi:hypothetical protein